MEISKEELALLEKIGVSLDTVMKIAKKKVNKNEVPENDLSSISGEMILSCACCGETDKYYVDYLKRKDAPGFVLKRVDVPSGEVSRQHHSVVFSCSNCANDQLGEFEPEDLVAMILNLRNILRKGVAR